MCKLSLSRCLEAKILTQENYKSGHSKDHLTVFWIFITCTNRSKTFITLTIINTIIIIIIVIIITAAAAAAASMTDHQQ